MRAVGVDISKWQGKVNFTILANKVDFCIVRSSFGSSIDAYYWENIKGLKTYPEIFRGAYHYWLASESPDKQASCLRDTIDDKDLTLPLFIDVENNSNLDWGDKLSRTKRLREFLLGVEQRFGQKPWIYSNYYHFFDVVGIPDWTSQYMFWQSYYPYNPKPQTTWPVPIRGANPESIMFWQYSERGDGKSYGASSPFIDLNVFKGEPSELFGIAWNPIENIVKPFEPYVVTTTANLNIRSGPGVQYPIQATAVKGSKWEIMAEDGGWGKVAPNKYFSLYFTKRS